MTGPSSPISTRETYVCCQCTAELVVSRKAGSTRSVSCPRDGAPCIRLHVWQDFQDYQCPECGLKFEMAGWRIRETDAVTCPADGAVCQQIDSSRPAADRGVRPPKHSH